MVFESVSWPVLKSLDEIYGMVVYKLYVGIILVSFSSLISQLSATMDSHDFP